MTQRVHRLVGYLAVAHAALMLGSALLLIHYHPFYPVQWYLESFWVAFATLWFLWPIVIVLTARRPFWRGALPLIIAVVLAVLWLPFYTMVAPPYIGLPRGVTLSPVSMSRYFIAYWRGRADANKDVQSGHLAVEVYGGPGTLVPLYHQLKERYGVAARPVASCVVDEQILGRAAGYNRISSAEVKRRFGVSIIDPVDGTPITKPLDRGAQSDASKN